MNRAAALLLLASMAGCAMNGASGVASPTASSAASPDGSPAALPEGAPRAPLAWADYSAETFARAKRERKYVILDGAAEWCHWCHVMEATSYHDPRVREILDKHFIAMKIDVDARPDLEERYGDWGWPATIVFSPDANEIGKYKGYIAPDDFVRMLADVVASGVRERGVETARPKPRVKTENLSEQTLAWIEHDIEVSLDAYYDDEQGGFGRMQKAPIGPDNAWLLHRARAGDLEAQKKVLFTLKQQTKILDPIWGGIYQYSAARDWDHPHFEKLMTFQAPALENYAEAYALTKDTSYLQTARATLKYMDELMRGPDGGFYTTQDADVNAHDTSKPFMSGHEYYALGDAERRAHGMPRIDAHEYARENGLAIAAHVSFYEATKDVAALGSAQKAADNMYTTHITKSGGVAHDAKPESTVLYLADNAAFGLGLARLYEATHDEKWLAYAERIATFIERDLVDPETGALFANTVDPGAAGVFAERRMPIEHELVALRFFAQLARAKPASATAHGCMVLRLLSAVCTPEQISAQGRWLGDYLLALEETRGSRTCTQ